MCVVTAVGVEATCDWCTSRSVTAVGVEEVRGWCVSLAAASGAARARLSPPLLLLPPPPPPPSTTATAGIPAGRARSWEELVSGGFQGVSVRACTSLAAITVQPPGAAPKSTTTIPVAFACGRRR